MKSCFILPEDFKKVGCWFWMLVHKGCKSTILVICLDKCSNPGSARDMETKSSFMLKPSFSTLGFAKIDLMRIWLWEASIFSTSRKVSKSIMNTSSLVAIWMMAALTGCPEKLALHSTSSPIKLACKKKTKKKVTTLISINEHDNYLGNFLNAFL